MKTKRVHSYTFRGYIRPKPGRPVTVIPLPTRARYATKAVEVEISEADILNALKADGIGDSANCAGNFGLCRQVENFPHNVETDYIDWNYMRVAVCNKITRGLPRETVLYALYSNLPRLFDSHNGLLKLLKTVRESGPIRITLYPVKEGRHYKTGKPSRPTGTGLPGRSGARTTALARGAALRRQHRLIRGIAAIAPPAS